MITDTGIVTKAEKLSDGIYSMWIKTEIAAKAKCGQFVAIFPAAGETLLQRPISICEISADSVRIVYRVAGKGTAEFSKYKEGDSVRLLGPCGNGFDTNAMTKDDTAFLIAGGIGVPPMLQLGKALKAEGKSFKFVLGYRNSDMFLIDEFKKVGEVCIATEDGSVGTKGNVMDAIRENNLSCTMIYSCGPMPMLRAIKSYSEDKGIDAYISLEERMACGVGACLGCVTKTKKVDGHSHVKNARICMEGPVFLAKEVEI